MRTWICVQPFPCVFQFGSSNVSRMVDIDAIEDALEVRSLAIMNYDERIRTYYISDTSSCWLIFNHEETPISGNFGIQHEFYVGQILQKRDQCKGFFVHSCDCCILLRQNYFKFMLAFIPVGLPL